MITIYLMCIPLVPFLIVFIYAMVTISKDSKTV
jgi:hypothetical protein